MGTGEKATDGTAHDGLDQCVWMCSVFVSTNAIAVQSGGKSFAHYWTRARCMRDLGFACTPVYSNPHEVGRGRFLPTPRDESR